MDYKDVYDCLCKYAELLNRNGGYIFVAAGFKPSDYFIIEKCKNPVEVRAELDALVVKQLGMTSKIYIPHHSILKIVIND